jgi:hypothetical protein
MASEDASGIRIGWSALRIRVFEWHRAQRANVDQEETEEFGEIPIMEVIDSAWWFGEGRLGELADS